ncbi:MAG: 23S rRNA (adenine(2503)-C(2))-methyltransferase RlmN [Bacteroidales bacterium]|nr:23S rRNA (adenine(2503)-C(2))-methyltransferase RlmN [Bacteroidales bacterium]MBN2820202.1 23S rRNA (adenine(2503)-C(2))-methyltransferase RlmN [Bacteroidales bacterium]
MEKIKLIGLTPADLKEFTEKHNIPKYIGKEVLKWVYQKDAKSFDEMTNLSVKAREQFNNSFIINPEPPVKYQESTDGTRKYLFETIKDKFIETAYMPEENRNTLCVSSQVGCKMGCKFCMTARQGLQGQLSAGDIVNQILSLPERHKLTNIVFMGMGEPFDNLDEVLKALEILTADWGFQFSPRKINVSTIGLLPGIKRFLKESKCNLAISLHSPFDEERKKLMPVQRLYAIESVIKVLREFPFENQRRLSFEYIVFKGINDTDKDVKQLARLLNGLKCRINLMHFHSIPGSSLIGSSTSEMQSFQEKLKLKGIFTTIRKSRGEDILAACGLLSTGEIMKRL